MDNNAIYQKLDSIKNEIYEKIKMSEYFLLIKEQIKDTLKLLKN